MKTKTHFKSKAFNASMLKIGEMMEVTMEPCKSKGEIILRTYDSYISLSNPRSTWGNKCTIEGRKLLPGESITLIQE